MQLFCTSVINNQKSKFQQKFRFSPLKLIIVLGALWLMGNISHRQEEAARERELDKYCSKPTDESLVDDYRERCYRMLFGKYN